MVSRQVKMWSRNCKPFDNTRLKDSFRGRFFQTLVLQGIPMFDNSFQGREKESILIQLLRSTYKIIYYFEYIIAIPLKSDKNAYCFKICFGLSSSVINQETKILFVVNIKKNAKLSLLVYDKNFFLENIKKSNYWN